MKFMICFAVAALLTSQAGPWQTPGPFQTPSGPWQTPGKFQVPKGIQALTWHDSGCNQRFSVGADALFAFDKATLSTDAGQTLSALGPMIKKKAGTHAVRIDGYTDSIGSDSYNLDLSVRRARTVRDWLATYRYVSAATAIRGFGKENPVAPNINPDGSDNPAGRQKNRRVEVVVSSCPS